MPARPGPGGDRRRRMACLLLLLLPACATRVPIPSASEHEVDAVRRELRGFGPAEVARDANHRFWDLFFDDGIARAELPPETLRSIDAVPRAELVPAWASEFEAEAGVSPWELSGLSPAVLGELATQVADAGTARTLLAAAGLVEGIHAVVARRTERVAARVAAAAGRSDVVVVLTPEAGENAFVPVEFGADRLYLGARLALLAASDDELACVLGHELAHITEGHTTSGAWANVGRTSLQVLVSAAAAAAMAYANDGVPLSPGQVDAAIGLGALTRSVLVDVPIQLSGWRRGQEDEADAAGLLFVHRAGYDPAACPRLLARVVGLEGGATEAAAPSWWDTHPVTVERVVKLRKLAREAAAGGLDGLE